MRQEIKWFAEKMNNRLEDNSHKDVYGWKDLTVYQLQYHIHQNQKQLLNALQVSNKEQVLKSATDIANYAMMIADNIIND